MAESLVAQGIPACVRSSAWRFVLDPNWESGQQKRLPIDQIAAIAQPPAIALIGADLAHSMLSQTSVRDSLRKIFIVHANLDPGLG
jgi:hypothetical protein